MRRLFKSILLLVLMTTSSYAQRKTDTLDRGLVAVPTGSSGNSSTNVITWRRLAEEYYGVTYNLYKDGSLLASGLTSPCYADNSRGYSTTQYQVSAVVNGVEQSKCAAVTPWNQYVYNLVQRCPTGYIDLTLSPVYNRNGIDVSDNYYPNDAEFADLDGDGQLEMIIKRYTDAETSNGSNMYPVDAVEFDVFDAYDINWQTGAVSLMWRLDVGPNMVSLNRTELNLIAYDWDEDGKAEVALRGADNMIMYGSDGKTKLYTIGSSTANERDNMTSHSNAQYIWTITGSEYLVYFNGETGAQYQVTEYPLKRYESGESNLNSAWGDNYGHRSTKHFFGAPVLDGRNASLFLARGIYTRHKMAALDLDKSTHTWSTRWTWYNNGGWSDPWYANGNHNFSVADVDEDGRDEIIYGSMVIDDNGKGLSTTGLGHGDALHCSDFDPFRQGLEIFACNEEEPCMNYRNATTSELYVRRTSSTEDGRALCGNFTDTYPGACGRSTQTGMISCVADCDISELGGDDFINWGDLNFRIYWDGDLLSEILNSPGTAKEAKIEKPGTGRLFTSSGCNMNNDSKNNACFQGDLIGDWREEIALRCGHNVRIYTTGYYTSYNIYTLWHDHEYRQAMVWQMMAYNQPPHLSYFLGETEEITVAPPPLTLTGRSVINSGGTITGATNSELLTYGYGNYTYNLISSLSPKALIMNVPVWTQGNDNNNSISTTTYTHSLNISGNGNLTGTARLVKMGKGVLNISNVTLSHTGNTDIWGGTLNFNGTLTNSKVWMNRFTTLNSSGGNFPGGLEMCYGSRLNVGGATAQTLSTVNIGALTLNYGSRVVLDINSLDSSQNDKLNMNSLTIGTKNWNYGPQYQSPVFYINASTTLGDGMYPIGTIGNEPSNLDKVVIESNGNVPSNAYLTVSSGILYLVIGDGVPKEISGVEFNISGMNPYATHYYLPQVTAIAYDGTTTLPVTMSGTFTGLDGSTTIIGSNIYSHDFENESSVTGWTSGGAAMSITSGDATYGNYFMVNTGTTNTRYAYNRELESVDLSGYSRYKIEFDLAIKSGNTDGVEFCVMSKGGTSPSNNWDNYAAINSNKNMLFDLTTGKNSTTFTVNGSSTTTMLDSETWYHYTLLVDQNERTVDWTISNGDTGTFELPEGTSTEASGFYLVAGRYYSTFCLDNIKVTSTNTDTFRFTKLGTLSVTATATGYAPVSAIYEVNYPYAIYYESPDYDKIAKEDVATTLGADLWNSSSYGSRWANWSKTNGTYGESYQMVEAINASGYVDKDSVITIGYSGQSLKLTLIEGFGIGQNSTRATAITASGLGDEETIIYYKGNTSRGSGENYNEGYALANTDGSFTYYPDPYNSTFCKLIAYIPIHEEYDENSTTPPSGSGHGNVAFKRTFSSITSGSGWNSLVLPFSMSEQQIRTVFGPGSQVAQLVGSSQYSLQFYNESRFITANRPCLIRVGDVHDDGFYVISDVNRSVENEPKVETDYFDFIGTYANQGTVRFAENTYFFNSSNGNELNKVAAVNNIKFQGFRAYFSAKGGGTLSKTVNVEFGDGSSTFISEIDGTPTFVPMDIYTIGGQLLRKNSLSIEGLTPGVYIVGGRKVIIKSE